MDEVCLNMIHSAKGLSRFRNSLIMPYLHFSTVEDRLEGIARHSGSSLDLYDLQKLGHLL
jgi:hypothetical protein